MTLRELVHWDRPFNVPVRQRNRFGRSLMSLQEDMNSLFQSFFGESGMSAWTGGFESFSSIDIIENERDFKVKVELAGMNPEDVEVAVTNGFLTIKGEKKEEKEEKGDNYLRRESAFGAFQRTVALPETAEMTKAEASFKNGILNIDVPKKAEAVEAPQKLQIRKAG